MLWIIPYPYPYTLKSLSYRRSKWKSWNLLEKKHLEEILGSWFTNHKPFIPTIQCMLSHFLIHNLPLNWYSWKYMKIYILSLIYEFYNCKGCLSLIFYSHKQRLEIPKNSWNICQRITCTWMTLTIIASILFKTIFYSKSQEAITEPEHGDQNKGMKFQRVNQVLQKCLPLPLIIPNPSQAQTTLTLNLWNCKI